MEPAHGTPRARFSSTLGSMGTPARRGAAPGTPLSARRTLDRSTRGPNPFSYSTNNATGTPKNIFRASMTGDRTRHTFTPRASSTLRQAYSPVPPSSVRSFRGSTATATGTSIPKPSSAELFNQTIDDPPAALDGQALVNQVPDDPTRQGSVYADEFLAHTCPPGLDDLGRRQWFCILDLRRLKYAANELFAKKDWKINIANFSKEYEKSRGLIMLRYGLYEFQTVKPTDEQVRKWRKDHDIPDPDEEATPARRAQTGGSKRKAEEEMPLATSKSNKNKRRQTEPAEPLGKGKRRAASDSDQDENQPAKMHKSNTPSHALTAFMKAAGGKGDSQPTPSKPSSAVFAGRTNLSSAISVLDDPKAASAPSPNPFEHLSDASRAPSNAEESAESDGADSEADDSEDKDASEPSVSAASGGVGTPADREGTPSQNLFARVQKDKDGQPIRVLDGESDTPKLTSFAPSNQTWSTSTPIKFAGSSNPFGIKSSNEGAEKPAPFKPMFGAKKLDEPKEVPVPAPAPSTSKPMFAAAPAKVPEVESKPDIKADATPTSTNVFKSLSKPAEAIEAPKPTTTNIFGGSATPTQPPTTAPSSGLFGSATQVNGTKAPAAAPSTNGSVLGSSTLFGAKPAESTEAPKSTSLFGSATAPSADKPATSLFGTSTPSSGETSKPLFGATTTSEAPTSKPLLEAATAGEKGKLLFGTAPEASAKPVFGAATTGTEDKMKTSAFGSTAPSEPPAKKLFGGAAADNKTTSSIFGAGTGSAEKSTPLFGGSSQPSTLFGGSTTAPAPTFGTSAPASDANADKAKPLFSFGDASKPAGSIAPSADSKPSFSFGGNSSQPTPSFGEKKPEAAPAPALFGNSTQPQQSGSIFGGGQSGTSTPASSFSFSAAPANNPFASQNGGSASGTNTGFSFGSTPADSKPTPSATFMFGGTGTSPQPSAPGGFSFGASTPGTPPATASGAPSFSFTGATPTGSSNNMFAPQPSGLAAPGGTSTGTSSPFYFGGASSLATTPAATTPEPTTAADEGSSKQPAAEKPAEEGEEKHSQINLTEGGPGEEDEEVVYDVRCKALKEELESPKDSEGEGNGKEKKSKSAWSTKGVGPLRILKHKTTGAVRLVLRAEPRGNVVLNSMPIPTMPYTVNGKYVVAAFPSEKPGLDKWMLMVKTADAAKALADAINKYKKVEKPE